MKFSRPRLRRRTWLALTLIVGAVAWNSVRESPKEMASRLGASLILDYRGPKWLTRFGAANVRGSPANYFCVPIGIKGENTEFNDNDAGRLARCKSLESLSLGGTRITDEGLAHIATLPRLRQLSLNGTRITDHGLQALAGMPALESLDLSDTQITDRAIASLSAVPRLRRLHLARTDVSGAALSQLAALARLEDLDLSGTRIQDNDLPSLRKSLVTTLWLCDTSITDLGIAHLRHAQRICGMYLPRTQITERVFAEFEKFPTLGWVSVSVTEAGITEEEIKEFSARQSRIRVAVQPDQ